MKKYFQGISAFMLILSGVDLSAQEILKSEYFWQGQADQNIITPEYRFNSRRLDFSKNRKIDFEGSETYLTYERGFNQNLSGGVAIGYTDATGHNAVNRASAEVSGLNNVELFIKAQNKAYGDADFHYGAVLSISTEDQEIKNDEQNAALGGNFIKPYIGMKWPVLSSHTIGSRVQTEVLLNDQTVKDNGQTMKKDGGENTNFSVFYEVPHAKGLVGFSGFYQYTNDLNSELNGVKSKELTSYNSLGVEVYSPYNFDKNTAVIGSIKYLEIIDDTISGLELDAGQDLGVQVAGRFAF